MEQEQRDTQEDGLADVAGAASGGETRVDALVSTILSPPPLHDLPFLLPSLRPCEHYLEHS